MEIFDTSMPFYRGNLHCHTTRSDGVLAPEAVVETYRNKGYDFLALTDHRLLSEPTHMSGNMLLLSGIEMDYMLPGQALHLIGIGMDERLAARDYRSNPQLFIDQVHASGGRAIVAHPAWSLNAVSVLCALQNADAAEVYNSVSTIPWNGDRADSSQILDQCAVRGKLFRFVASDDSHFYNGEAGTSATMVQATALTQEALFEAIDAGRFYATRGPRFTRLSITSERVEVECSPCAHVVFYSNLVWGVGRCVTGDGLTRAVYDLTKQAAGERFIRVQLVDDAGNSAWSSPISLGGSNA